MLITGSKGVAKHLFSDMPTAATETSPVTMPKMYGKPCCIHYYTETSNQRFSAYVGRLHARLVRLRRFAEKNLQHTTYKAFAEAELNRYGRFDLDMNSRLALF